MIVYYSRSCTVLRIKLGSADSWGWTTELPVCTNLFFFVYSSLWLKLYYHQTDKRKKKQLQQRLIVLEDNNDDDTTGRNGAKTRADIKEPNIKDLVFPRADWRWQEVKSRAPTNEELSDDFEEGMKLVLPPERQKEKERKKN